MEEQEQGWFDSVVDTISDAGEAVYDAGEAVYDAGAAVGEAVYDAGAAAGEAVYDSVTNVIDRDHDGACIDDIGGFAGKAYVTLGAAAAGAAIGAVAGAPAAGVGAIPGAIAGAVVGAAGGLFSDVGQVAGEEVGDFTSDALGTRTELPYGDEDCADLDYKDGRHGAPTPEGGLGYRLNEYVTGD